MTIAVGCLYEGVADAWMMQRNQNAECENPVLCHRVKEMTIPDSLSFADVCILHH